MTRDFNIIQLANAVQWWMSYTTAVGRSYVLTESAIKFPLAEYLERSNLMDLKLEYSHPQFFKRRFDLYFKDEKGSETVIEFKYIKDGSTRTTDEMQRVFNDLMRLQIYLQPDKKGYFLICGAQNDFVNSFQRILNAPAATPQTYITEEHGAVAIPLIESFGFYTGWFSFDKAEPEKQIDLSNADDLYKNIYDGFIEEYNSPYKRATGNDLTLPKFLKTRLIYLSPEIEQSMSFYNPSKIGIWEVVKED